MEPSLTPFPMLSPESQTSPYNRQIVYSQSQEDYHAELDMRYAPQPGALQSYQPVYPLPTVLWSPSSPSQATTYSAQFMESQSQWNDTRFTPQSSMIQSSELMMPISPTTAYSPQTIESLSHWDDNAGLSVDYAPQPQPDMVQQHDSIALLPSALQWTGSSPTSQMTAYGPQIMDDLFSELGRDIEHAPQPDTIQPSQLIASPSTDVSTTPSNVSQLTVYSPQNTVSSSSSDHTGSTSASDYVPQPAPQEEGTLEITELQDLPERNVPQPRIPRPPNAFILFRRHYVSQHKSKKLKAAVISKYAAEEWMTLSGTERARWVKSARALAEEHKRQYPDYQYRPDRTKRRRKSLKFKMCYRDESSSTIDGYAQTAHTMMVQTTEHPGSWNESSSSPSVNGPGAFQGETSGNHAMFASGYTPQTISTNTEIYMDWNQPVPPTEMWGDQSYESQRSEDISMRELAWNVPSNDDAPVFLYRVT